MIRYGDDEGPGNTKAILRPEFDRACVCTCVWGGGGGGGVMGMDEECQKAEGGEIMKTKVKKWLRLFKMVRARRGETGDVHGDTLGKKHYEC